MAEDAARNLAPDDENRLALWLVEACRAVSEQAEKSNTDDDEKWNEPERSENPHRLDGEYVQIVIRHSELKMIIDVAVANTLTLIDCRTISSLRSCADDN